MKPGGLVALSFSDAEDAVLRLGTCLEYFPMMETRAILGCPAEAEILAEDFKTLYEKFWISRITSVHG